MADHLDEIFPGDQEEQAEPAPEVVAEEVAQEAIAEPETVEQPQEPVETAAQEAEARQVPLNVVLDERDKRKAAEADRDRYKRQWEESQQRQAPQDVPDPYDDPKGFAAYQEQRVQEAVTQQRFQMSELMAKQQHGEETVNAASTWALEKAQSDPTFAAAYHRQAHPIDWIVQQHKRDAMLSDIGDNVDDWFTREAAKRGYAPASVEAAAPAVAQTQQASPPVKVPRSLATQGSGDTDVRQVATGPLAGVDAIFS
jgi:hypothetical protein